jgi:hypothetical protein
VRVEARRRIVPDDALRPELVAPDGEWVAVSKPYREGRLFVFASSFPFTNDGLRDAETARYMYTMLTERLNAAPSAAAGSATGPVVVFDEAHRAIPGTGGGASGEASLERRIYRWVLGTSIGSAAVYALALVFVYLLLSGRRLGPPLRAVSPASPVSPGSPGSPGRVAGGANGHTVAGGPRNGGNGGMNRTMYEHVQALAGLYRRSRPLGYVRAHYARHYRRRIARDAGTDAPVSQPGPLDPQELVRYGIPPERAARLAAAVAEVEAARGERHLAAAVRSAEAALADSRRRVAAGPVPSAQP